MKNCPFQAGDIVVYRPTDRGLGQGVMTDLAALKPGKRYRIAQIVKNQYVVLEGFKDSPAGGIYWTEFCPT